MTGNLIRSLDPRSLLPPVAVLAGIVLLGAAPMAAQGLFATVAFGVLAAVVCRRLQLLLLRRGLGPTAAVAVTDTVFVLVIGSLAVAFVFDYVLQPRMMSTNLDLSPVVVIVSILFRTFVIGAMGAVLAAPLTIALRAVLLPYPGARWFVALLGPVPGETEKQATSGTEAVPG